MAAATLDDPQALAIVDRGGMLELAGSLGAQLRRGLEIGRASGASDTGARGASAVVICGMGGSGIAGDIARALFADTLPVPIVVHKDHGLPAFAGPGSVVMAVSFSGETEETLDAFAEGVRRGCRMVAVSAGGGLGARAGRARAPHVRVPGDVSMPRAALGYLCGATIGWLEAAGIVPAASLSLDAAANALAELAGSLGPGSPTPQNEAKQVASWVADRVPVIWGVAGPVAAAALRWKTQFNENAKTPAFVATLPELDHNDLEGWSGGRAAGFAAVVLRTPSEAPRVSARIEATIETVEASGLRVREVRARGETAAEHLFSLVMVGDFASVYAAIGRGVDPTPVPTLTGLKERLRG